MERVLAAIPNETAVPLTEIGHFTESFDADAALAWIHGWPPAPSTFALWDY